MFKDMSTILVCPNTKESVHYDAERKELVCETSGLAYPIIDGVPVMIPGLARRIDDDLGSANHG